MKKKPDRILVCRTDALGDTLLTLPVCQALKHAFPEAIVDMLVASYTQPIIQNHTSVDHVLVYDKMGPHQGWAGLHTLITTVRSEKYDTALIVFPDRRISWALWCAGIPCRIGTGRRWWSFLYNKKVNHSRALALKHEADYNLDLVRALDLEVRLQAPHLDIASKEQQWAETFYQKMDQSKTGKWVIIHPGGHGSSSNWSPEHYGKLAEQLIERHQCKILLTGSKKEQSTLDLVAAACRPKLYKLEETVSLPELAALIQQADLFIAGNTGPLHMAAALDVPVVTVFPASGVTGPERWGPLGNRVGIFTPPSSAGVSDVHKIKIEDVAAAAGNFIS